MRLINHSYTFEFQPEYEFEYGRANEIVGYEGYEDLEKEIPIIAKQIKENQSTRQAILTLNKGIKYMSCLVSIQWVVDNSRLYCIATFRSQHAELGRPSDEKLLNYLCTDLLTRLWFHGLEFDFKTINVNVADYHIY